MPALGDRFGVKYNRRVLPCHVDNDLNRQAAEIAADHRHGPRARDIRYDPQRRPNGADDVAVPLAVFVSRGQYS